MRRLLSLLLLGAPLVFGQYAYYYTDTLTTINTTNWYKNASVTATSAGLTATSANGGSLISKIAAPGGLSQYEVRTTLTLAASGGTYITYLRASNDAMSGSAAAGTYYSVELQNPTFTSGICAATMVVNKRVSGSVTMLGSQVVSCHSGMIVRAIFLSTQNIQILIDDGWWSWTVTADTSITSGQPGVGAYGTPTGNSIAKVDLGPLDTLTPNSIDTQTVELTNYPNRVDFRFQGVTDHTNGIGVFRYSAQRNDGLWFTSLLPEFSDATVSANTPYTYTIYATDYHLNTSSPVTINITTPVTGAIDARRIGVRPTGAYWGAAGEQIDTLSGNVNFTAPLFQAQGRGGSSVPFALSYNSQLWRQDSGSSWKLGEDVGYGFGWRLMAGSLTPYYYGYLTVHHYVFTDSTGAQYRLDTNTGGVWTSSTESVHVWYDSNVNWLRFPDGSFWVLGATSGGKEQDAGTMYPTLMYDSNGNQVIITYNTGLNASASNSCARIAQIEDVRAAAAGASTWTFTYGLFGGDPVPHLSSITSQISGEPSWQLTYSSGVALNSPFSLASFGNTIHLTEMKPVGDRLKHYKFAYDASGSGELTQVTTPRSGLLQWNYRSFTYTGSRMLREVQTRVLTMQSGGLAKTYTFSHDDASDAGSSLHSWTKLDDPSGNGQRQWTFANTGVAWQLGLATNITYRTGSPSYTALKSQDYTWVLDGSGNHPYIGTALTTLDPGTGNQQQSKNTQTVDNYGSVTQTAIFDYGNLITAARTYNNTYLSTSAYTNRYILNRLLTTTVSSASQNYTLVTNTYDGANPADAPSVREHDATFSTTFQTRGNLTSTTPLGGLPVTIAVDITGNAVIASDTQGHSVAPTSTIVTNFVVPSTITTNGDSNSNQNLGYTASLAPNSYAGPNSATASVVYNDANQPTSSTSVDGAVTTYTYSAYTEIPSYVIATTNGRWVKTSYDGFDRPINVQRGYSTTTVSNQDTSYAPCACSPIGKVYQVSQPYAPGGAVYYTTYTYDGLGRPTSVLSADGSSTTTYAYAGNTVTVTDPAGKWKQTVTDVFGNIKTVNEPNPAGGANLATTYTYDVLNHLNQVSMTRGSTTQLRTFVYDTSGRLYTEAHPESGTTTYAYNTDGTLFTKIDAKNQKLQYTYDSYQRVLQIQHYPVSTGSEDMCQRYTFTYGTAVDSTYTWGQPTSVVWAGSQTGCTTLPALKYTYGAYTQSGRLLSKTLNYALTGSTASYTYNNEGQVLSVRYPAVNDANFNPAYRTYTYTYDAMSRPITLTDNQTTPLVWVQSATYGPSDEMQQLMRPNTATTTDAYANAKTFSYAASAWQYNSRLQVTQDGAGATYTYSPTQNNGEVQTRTYSGGTTSYTYDALKRLSAASSSTWGTTYTYDGFGNLTDKTVTLGSAPPLHVTVNAATNQVNTTGYTYDLNGNLTALPGVGTPGYDVENRMTTVALTSGGTESDSYGPDNRRVWSKSASNAETMYLYGAKGELLVTYSETSSTHSLVGAYVYFAGRRIWSTSNVAVLTDRLGSTASLNLYPYGEGANSTDFSFATYYHSSVTGLEYAHNRYYSSILARFATPDPSSRSARLGSPQSWNRYPYVLGDPVNRNDPTGLDDDDDGNLRGNKVQPSNGGVDSGAFPEAPVFEPTPVMTVSGDEAPVPSKSSPNDSDASDAFSGKLVINSDNTKPGQTNAANNGAGGSKVSVGYTINVVASLLAGLGPALTYTKIPSLNLTCVGGGLGASGGHNFSFGPTVVSTAGAKSILSSWSFSFGYNLTPSWGGGFSVNSSGGASGNTFGVPGMSAAVTWSNCWGGGK